MGGEAEMADRDPVDQLEDEQQVAHFLVEEGGGQEVEAEETEQEEQENAEPEVDSNYAGWHVRR